MEKEAEFRQRCAARGLPPAEIEEAVRWAAAMVSEVDRGPGFAAAGLGAIQAHVAGLRTRGEATEARILALGRYCYAAGHVPGAIWFSSVLLPIGVLPAFSDRLAFLEGEETRARVFAGVEIPEPGSPPEAYPAATAAFVAALKAALPPDRAKRVLCANIHGVPASAFAAEKAEFEKCGKVEEWLAGYHARQVEVLAKHAADGTPWFEQRITPKVVEWVAARPEILGGVKSGDRILATKIPYDPDAYIGEEDPLKRRILACHCPLAASAIGAEGSAIDPIWCNCSAGFEKALYDAVFGLETEVEVLESVLSGSELCRFAIRVPPAF